MGHTFYHPPGPRTSAGASGNDKSGLTLAPKSQNNAATRVKEGTSSHPEFHFWEALPSSSTKAVCMQMFSAG